MNPAVTMQPSQRSSSPQQYSDTEKQAVIKHWQASGLSKAEFCRREGIGESRFYSWTRPVNMNLSDSTQKKSSLTPVKISGPSNALNRGTNIMIDLKNGMRITLPMPSNTQVILDLVKALSCS